MAQKKQISNLALLILLFSFLIPETFQAESRNFELPKDAMYHYRAHLYGGWGADQKPILPLGVQLSFDARTFDFPCCPNGAFLNNNVTPPSPSGFGIDLNGYTLNPPSARISLLSEIIFFNRSNSPSIFYSESNYRPIASHNPLLNTPENDKNRRYLIRFHLQPDFSIRFEQAPFDLTPQTYPAQTDFRDHGGSDILKSNLYTAVVGKIQLPSGLPKTSAIPAPGSAGSLEPRMFYRADKGWQSHYDVIAQTRINGLDYVANIPYVQFKFTMYLVFKWWIQNLMSFNFLSQGNYY
jgi:hypothetical protein